jgi:hypothetical protein
MRVDYSVLITRAPSAFQADRDGGRCVLEAGEWIPVRSAGDGRAARARIELAGGSATVLPSRYRDRPIDEATAATLASKGYDHLVLLRPAGSLGPLTRLPAYDSPAAWAFGAEDLTPENAERIPGICFLEIDRHDGHLWTEADDEEIAALNRDA